MLKFVKTSYENIGRKFSGHTQEFHLKIDELNRDIERLHLTIEHEKEINEQRLKNKDLQLIQKDLTIDNLKKDLYIKELEVKLMGKL
jgi:hypothetical protein